MVCTTNDSASNKFRSSAWLCQNRRRYPQRQGYSLMNRVSHKKRRVITVIALLVVAVYVIFLFPSTECGALNKDDSSLFFLLGFNLAQSGKYTCDTISSADFGRHATWPFGFPMMLAGVIRLFGANWYALKGVVVFMGLAHLFLLGRLWRGEREGEVAVLFVALSPYYFLFSHMTMTEIPFMFANVVTLLYFSRVCSCRTALIAGVLASVAFMIRGYAIVFLPAGILYLLMQTEHGLKKRIGLVLSFAVPLFATVVLWKIFTDSVINAEVPLDYVTSRFGNTGEMAAAFSSPRHFVEKTYWFHLRSFSALFTSLSWSFVQPRDMFALIGALIAIVCAAGFARSWYSKRELTIVHIWLCGSVFLQLILSTSPRYWLTSLPFLVYYALHSLQWISSIRWSRRLFAASSGGLLILAMIGLFRHLDNPNELRFVDQYFLDHRDAAAWVAENMNEGVVLISPHAHQCFAASIRDTIPLSETTSLDSLGGSAKEVYLLLSTTPSQHVGPTKEIHEMKIARGVEIAKSSEQIKRVGVFQIYRVQ